MSMSTNATANPPLEVDDEVGGLSEEIEQRLKLSPSEEGEGDKELGVLDLPELAQAVVLKYLTVWSCMDLRVVCKTTNKWVENYGLSKMQLVIKTHAQLEEVIKDSVTPWTNIVIRCDALNNDINWIRNPLYPELLNNLSSSLSSLNLEDHRLPYVGLKSILSTCGVLKNIKVGTLWCGGWTQEKQQQEEQEEQKVIESMNRLESIGVSYLAWNETDDLDLFAYILQRCTSVTFLKVPHILMANFFHATGNDEDDDETERKYLELIKAKLVNPLVDFVKCLRRKDSKKLKGRLDVQNMHHTEVFPTLACACAEARVRIISFSEALEEPIPSDQLPALEAMESLAGFTSYLDFHRLINLKSMELDSETSADSDVSEASINAPLPKLQSVSFCLPPDISPNILKFLSVPRSNVTSLAIEFQVGEPKLSEMFPLPLLTEKYQQLKKLTLTDWEGTDDHLISILSSLTNLESLRLQGCPKITDRGFIGDDLSNPVLLKLKGLKDLWMDCLISNDVLNLAVKNMSLEAFFYASDKVTLPGFLSLTQGPLTSTLLCFPVMPPDNCSDEMLSRVLSYFKNIKRKPMLSSFRCEVDVEGSGL